MSVPCYELVYDASDEETRQYDEEVRGYDTAMHEKCHGWYSAQALQLRPHLKTLPKLGKTETIFYARNKGTKKPPKPSLVSLFL